MLPWSLLCRLLSVWSGNNPKGGFRAAQSGRVHQKLLYRSGFSPLAKSNSKIGYSVICSFKKEKFWLVWSLHTSKNTLKTLGFSWTNIFKNVTQFLGGIFLYQKWSLTPHSSSFEINFWIFKSDLGSATGIPARLAMLEKSRNLQRRHFLIINELGLLTKNLLDI